MREKLSIEEFRKYKEEQQQLLVRLNEENEILKNSDNYNAEDFEKRGIDELARLQSRLFSYDLSDIPFEEWKDIALVSSDKYPADFSKTKANFDFSVLNIISSEKEVYNFRDCNVRNIDKVLGYYNDTFFDEKTIKENGNLFLLNDFSQDIKDKFYSRSLSIKDLVDLSDEQIHELENKSTHNFNQTDNNLINLLGVKKSIDLYKQDATTYKNIIELINVKYISKSNMRDDFRNILEKGTPAEIKTEIYNEIRKEISKYDKLNEKNYPIDFVEQNKDLFLKNIDIPKDIKDRYFNRCLTYQDVKDNLEIFKTIPIEFFMEKDDNFTVFCKNLGFGNFSKILEQYPETIDYLLENRNMMSEITELLPDVLKYGNCKGDMVQFIFNEVLKNYYIKYAKKNGIDITDENNKPPIWLQPLHIDKIIFKYNNVNEIFGYNTNTLLLDDSQRKSLINIEFIKQFEKETGILTHGDIKSLFYLLDFVSTHNNIIDSYESFQNEIANALDYNRKYNQNKMEYDYITGEFREKYPDIFIDFDAPEPLRKAFYKNSINSDFIKKNLECLEYIHTSNKPLHFYFNLRTSDLADNIETVLGKEEGCKLIVTYLDYLEALDFENINGNLSGKELIDAINTKIFESLVDGIVDYSIDMPESFKKKYPSLFIDDKVPKEIKDKFYNREFTLEDFDNDISLFDYFKDTNIACAFGKDYYWAIPLFANNDKANYSRLKVIAEYQKIADQDLRDVFKEYCSENALNLEDDKIKTVINVLERLLYSNSSEMYNLKKEIARQIVNLPNPLEKLDKMEEIFIKNNLPTVGKIYSCFEMLHPNLSGFNFDDDMISPILKHKSTMGRQFTIFSDLIRTTLASNNRSVNDYLDNIEAGSNLYREITSGKKSYDSLSEEDKKTMKVFSKHLETLYNSSMKGKKNPLASDKKDIEKIDELVTKLSPNGTSDYDIADRVVRMFCGYAGINTMKEARDFIKLKFQQAQLRNIQTSKHDMTLEKGDFIKGIGKITYLSSILENGCRAKEFLGADASSDSTPLDTDVSVILDDEGTTREKITRTSSYIYDYGPIYLVIKPDDDFIITRDNDGEKELPNDMTKIETFKTGAMGEDHWGIKIACPPTKIISLMMESYDERVGLIVAMSDVGYIPVRDFDGRTIFTEDDYNALRSKMSGLSHYKETDYNFSDNLVINEVEELKDEIEANNELTAKKREKINRLIEEAMQELGLELKTKIDGDLSSGVVELIDTGSTGRGTNKPGDGDFDFMMRLDRNIISKPEKISKVKQVLLRKINKDDTDEVTGLGDFRLKDVKLDEEDSVDIDISFVTKTDEVSYSTDMALEDRLETIKKIDKEKYNYVVANILLAKQVLKEANVYKPFHSDPSQGGLGGVGIENWILQNGGSFVDAMNSFLDAAKDKDFDEFKKTYSIWDFGENHMAARNGVFPYDNFVYNMSEVGYQKMKETLTEYKKSHGFDNKVSKQY